MTDTRCGTTDLLISQCACKIHRGGDLPKPTDGVLVERFLTAKFPGRCCLDDHEIKVGDRIGLAVPSDRPKGIPASVPAAPLGYGCEHCVDVITGRQPRAL